MVRIVRSLLIGWLLASYGAIAACGPGLHAVPGFGHSDEARPLGDLDGPGGLASTHDDCPVCHFCAQGQLPAEFSGGKSLERIRPAPPPPSPIHVGPRPCGPNAPRGPPPHSSSSVG